MSPTPSAPRDRGAHVPGAVPGEEPAARKRRSRARVLPGVAMLAAVLVLTTGCTQSAWMRLGMPAPVTQQGARTVSLWQGSWIAALAVGAVVWGLILWAVLFHRKRGDQPPMQVRYNLPIEMLYTVVPFIMVGVLFFFTARDENYINKLSPRPDVVVNVTGYQWSWEFQYPQYKVTGAPGNMVTVNGQPWSPVTGNRGVPVLVIPDHESVRFNLVSTDVVHSFWVPPFEFKRDVIPGHPNHFQVTPTKTGYFLGHCTELCGLYHSRMIFFVKILPPAQFSQWIHAQQAQQTAQATSAGGVS